MDDLGLRLAAQFLHVEIEDRRDVQRQGLREKQAADDSQSERASRFRARAEAKRNR